MRILLVYPRYPDTFWSFNHILKFVSKKASLPPLGLLTVAAMLPSQWEKKLIDVNITPLEDRDISWAECVFISAMITQKDSAKQVIKRCNKLGVRVVAGGPVFTTGHEEFEGVDHFISGEAEDTLPHFLEDLQAGCAKPVYVSDQRPDITHTPVPLWELINVEKYASLSLQHSRGCPYDCEFCDIVIMNGRVPRTKRASQIIRELRAIYDTGFRGAVFMVDDNFIGNKARARVLLPKMIRWQMKAGYPFTFLTEASLNLADDEPLMQAMVDAGFNKVFVGLETPCEGSLAECNKVQNKSRDMVAAVKAIQNHGMEVQGGFIVGFDHDPPSIFENQIKFIQNTGVVTAMVGLLTALPKTRLYKRLKAEGRLLKTTSGNNTDATLNFIPMMDSDTLIDGYYHILETIYAPRQYYQRITTFLHEYQPPDRKHRPSLAKVRVTVRASILSIWYLGIVGTSRRHFWKFVAIAAIKYRRAFAEAMVLAAYGHHFRKITEKLLSQTRAEER